MGLQDEHQVFTDELNRRIAVVTSPDYEDASVKPLQRIDYALIGVFMVLSLLVFVWGWY
jgi:hypothetical protein